MTQGCSRAPVDIHRGGRLSSFCNKTVMARGWSRRPRRADLILIRFRPDGRCGSAFEIRSAGNGLTEQEKSARRTSITCRPLEAAITLPKEESPAVTEV